MTDQASDKRYQIYLTEVFYQLIPQNMVGSLYSDACDRATRQKGQINKKKLNIVIAA